MAQNEFVRSGFFIPLDVMKKNMLSSLGPVHMAASQPAYRAGPVGETVFILCSYGEIPARLPR